MASACWLSIRALTVSRPGSPGPAPTMSTSPARKGCSASWNSTRHFFLWLIVMLRSLQIVDWNFDHRSGDAPGHINYTNLFIGEVTAGVFLPEITGNVVGPYPGVAVTDGEILALCTTTFHWSWFLPEAQH